MVAAIVLKIYLARYCRLISTMQAVVIKLPINDTTNITPTTISATNTLVGSTGTCGTNEIDAVDVSKEFINNLAVQSLQLSNYLQYTCRTLHLHQ